MTVGLLSFAFASRSSGWQQVAIGAGGFLTGHSVASDGTMAVRIDVYGGYIWNPTGTAINGQSGEWEQFITPQSIPESFLVQSQGTSGGVFEVCFAYNNSSVIYMTYFSNVDFSGSTTPFATVYKSTDKGKTWIATNFTPVTYGFSNSDMQPNGPNRIYAHRIGIDFNNSNNVLFGTENNGLFITQDGGATWFNFSSASVPFGAGQAGITGVFFDPTNSNKAYAFVNGTGLYVSTNINLGSSATWSLTTSGPTSSIRSDIDLHNGTYYSVDSGLSTLSKYASGAWSTALTQTGTNQITGVACDPNLADHIVVIDGFTNLNEGTSGTFGGWSGSGGSVHPLYSGTNDASWLSILTPFIGPDGIFFDRTVSRKFYVNTNNGFLTYTAPGAISTSTTVLWTSQSRGIEDLDGNMVVPIPGTSTVMLLAWDYGIWNKQTNQLSTYETTFGPIPTPGLAAGWSLDFAKNNTSFMAALTDGNYAGGTSPAGYYSTDGGNTWTAWLTVPARIGATPNIAVSTSSNIMWGVIGGVTPYVTTNGSSASPTWTPISGVPGIISTKAFSSASYNNSTGLLTCTMPSAVSTPSGADLKVFETTYAGVSITSGTYNNSTGDVSLTMSASTITGTGLNFFLSGLTGSGAAALDNTDPNNPYVTTAGTTGGTTVTLNVGAGRGSTTITGGTMTPYQILDGNYTVASTVTSSTTVTTNVGAGKGTLTITGGTVSGWAKFLQDDAEFGGPNSISLITDSVNLNTFYLIIPNVGTFRSTDSGSTWTAGDTSFNLAFAGSYQMKATPGIAQDFWVCRGIEGLSTGTALAHTTDGGNTYTSINAISPCYCFGFGAPKPGGSGYPAIYASGYNKVSATSSSLTVGTGSKTVTVAPGLTQFPVGTVAVIFDGITSAMYGQVTAYNSSTGSLTLNVYATLNPGASQTVWKVAVYGIWQSDDTGVTWKLVGGTQFINNTLDTVKDVSGDLATYGQVYTAMGGSGFAAYLP